jgi:predicted alpha/beta-fold hydrolase
MLEFVIKLQQLQIDSVHACLGHCKRFHRQLPGIQDLPSEAPVVILLPGLTGGGDDTYVRYAVKYAEAHGLRAVVFNSRGCGDTMLTTPQFYSSLFIGDLECVIAHVKELYPQSILFATGWSLGANILVNYLGIAGEHTPLAAASALCNPFNLTMGIEALEKGFNKIYDSNLAIAMGGMIRRNQKVWRSAGPEFQMARAAASPSVRAWDDAITRVSFSTSPLPIPVYAQPS